MLRVTRREEQAKTPTAKTMETVATNHMGCDGSHMITRNAIADSAMSSQLITRNHWRAECGALNIFGFV